MKIGESFLLVLYRQQYEVFLLFSAEAHLSLVDIHQHYQLFEQNYENGVYHFSSLDQMEDFIREILSLLSFENAYALSLPELNKLLTIATRVSEIAPLIKQGAHKIQKISTAGLLDW